MEAGSNRSGEGPRIFTCHVFPSKMPEKPEQLPIWNTPRGSDTI